MRGFTIVVIIYIHTVIILSIVNIPFVREQTKTAHFLFNNNPKMKNSKKKYKKRQNMEREKVLSEPNFSYRNHKNKNTKKPTSIIVSKITVLYFQIKVVPIIWKIVL